MARILSRVVLPTSAALFALVSCGIPTTGVVEAGGPARGVVPTIRVYFVADGTLIAVPRRTVAPVDVQSALDVLLQGPTEAERAKRITTRLPLTGLPPTSASIAPATDLPSATAATEGPEEASTENLVQVATQGDGMQIELAFGAGEVLDVAAAQLICTAVAAQRVAEPGVEPLPVTVTDANGRRVEGADVRCPDSLALSSPSRLPARN
jgi:hypothetical protein